MSEPVKQSKIKPRSFNRRQMVLWRGQRGQVLSWSSECTDGLWSQTVNVLILPDGKRVAFDIESAKELEIL